MEIQEELKEKIIETLNLEDIKPEDIDNDAPLFGDLSGFGLDSIDALELIVLLDRDYGIKIKNPNKSRDIFKSINVLSNFVIQNRKK